ncbi:MAG: hypothetical protein R6V46_07340, partial [Desulfatiglandaceae bacterium]
SHTYQFRFLKDEDRGRWGLFQKTAKPSLIPGNGSGASKRIPGQPQKGIYVETSLFSACTEPTISGLGAFYVQCRVSVAVF